jgi:hypothetical protein
MFVLVVVYLAAESTGVLGMLGDFHLLYDLTEGGTVSGAILASDANFLSTLSLERERKKRWMDEYMDG